MKLKNIKIMSCIMLIIILLSNSIISNAQNAIYINDYANILNSDTETYIQNATKELYSKSGVEIKIITSTTLSGKTIENYANELFNMFDIGGQNKKEYYYCYHLKKDKLELK